MKFKLDENLPSGAADLLATAGHDVSTALQQQLGGQPDSAIAEICKREGRSLVTLDTDFGNIQLYPPPEYPGLIVLRLEHQNTQNILQVLGRLLDRFAREPLFGHLWIVEEQRVRIRPGDE